MIRSCWNREPKQRPQASEIVEFLAINPHIVTPCLDVPLSSVQFEDTGQLQMHIHEKIRKFSISLRNRSSNSITSQRPPLWRNFSSDDENSSVIWDQPDSPIETLPRITETWTDNIDSPQDVISSNNGGQINIYDNPIDRRSWNIDNVNGVAEPLLGSPCNFSKINVNCNNDNIGKYVPLKPTANGYAGNTRNDNYCLHDSSAQVDSML